MARNLPFPDSTGCHVPGCAEFALGWLVHNWILELPNGIYSEKEKFGIAAFSLCKQNLMEPNLERFEKFGA